MKEIIINNMTELEKSENLSHVKKLKIYFFNLKHVKKQHITIINNQSFI